MIICCGMGGSSVAGELLSFARPDILVHWDWDLPTGQAGLPSGATKNDRVICTSWSGNTPETISSYNAARAAGIPVSVITTGGMLAEKATKDGMPLELLPDTHTPPRENVHSMTSALFKLLDIGELPTIDTAASETAAEQLATKIDTKIPVFYAAYPWRKVAGFCKTVINEDAKRHSWAASIPSMKHNELAGWTGEYQDSMTPVLIRTDDERPQDRADLDALIALFTKMRYTVPTIRLTGATALEKALFGYAVALRAGKRVADTAHIDASETAIIETFKRLKTK